MVELWASVCAMLFSVRRVVCGGLQGQSVVRGGEGGAVTTRRFTLEIIWIMSWSRPTNLGEG